MERKLTNRLRNLTSEPVSGLGVTVLFLVAIAIGSILGLSSPALGSAMSQGIDPTLLAMVTLLFFEVRLRAVAAGLANVRFMALAWGANFLVIPLIGYAIASLFLSGQPLLYTGLLIYFLAPCTDWFLGFTRMARGDTALGAALLPINMLTQLMLYPLWIWLFFRHTGVVNFETIPEVLLQWFLVPFVLAQVARWLLVRLLRATDYERITAWVGILIPFVTALLILQIFAANVTTIAGDLDALGPIFAAILAFFILTYGMAEALTRLFGLRHSERALLAMTTAARNAPLMLAVTAAAIPDQPIIYAALVIGMLVEFPHLTALKQVLLTRAAREGKSA
ncbi:MAG: arsenic resistance protein [Pseudomonadota bacterium]